MNIVVTGASKGIGRAIVLAFAADNDAHCFFVCARNEQQLNALKQEVENKYSQHEMNIFSCDMAVKNDVQAFANFILSKIQAVDILINNAGLYFPGSCYDEEDGVLEKMLDVNLLSAYRLTRLLLPGMMQEKKGKVFNICSIASLQAYPNGGSYSISKFALAGFTKNLREEMKPFNIKVTGVYPGATMSDSWAGSGVDENRLMQSADIAQMIHAAVYLSDRAVVEDIVLRPQLGDL